MMDYGMCQNCDEFHRGYCFCDGGPDEIIGEMIACEFYKERPQGEWIKDNSGNRFCSECGSSALYHEIGLQIESRFCPKCGAYMKGGIDNAPTVAINKDFYKTDKSNPINRSDLFQ